jgi:hypothetical protein
MEPPAVFRVAANRSRFWHPRPAPVGDLDPDNVVHHLDRNRHRLAGSTRAAMPQAIGGKLAHQQRSHVPARVTGTEHPAHERAGDPCPLRPPGKRHALPDRPPSHQRTRLPGRPPPGNHAGRRADTPGWTPESGANVKPGHPPEWAPEPRQAAIHNAPWPLRPSAMRPWTAQHSALQRYKVTRHGTETNAPLARDIATSGAFSQGVAGVVAGVGFEPT